MLMIKKQKLIRQMLMYHSIMFMQILAYQISLYKQIGIVQNIITVSNFFDSMFFGKHHHSATENDLPTPNDALQ